MIDSLNNQFLAYDGMCLIHSKINSNDSLHLNGYNEFRSNLFRGSNSIVKFVTNNQNSAYPDARNNSFIQNKFFDGSTISLLGQQGVQISNNVFVSDSSLLLGGCILTHSGTDIKITNNILFNACIGVSYSTFSDESIKGLIANNFIYCNLLNPLPWITVAVGLGIYNFKNIDILFNTIHTNFNFPANSGSATLSVYQSQSINSRILNNIIYNEGFTKALSVFDTADDIWDYNNIYTAGDTFASLGISDNIYLGSLSAWQQASIRRIGLKMPL
ncbi:MAG: hypothetical protein K1X82_14850 [Bacteroidia bacterium]|nr:hypothetical protein [Bacteroidia bacterium]